MTDEKNAVETVEAVPVPDEPEAVPSPVLEFGGSTSTGAEAAAAGDAPAPGEIKLADTADLAESAKLTEEDKKQIEAFVGKIDLADSAAILSYGVGAQRKVADFSQKALDDVRAKDMGQVGEELAHLVATLGEMDPDKEEGGFFLFRKTKNKAEELKARYSKVETNVRDISGTLEEHQRQLMKDIDLLDRMYELNQSYFKELTMYVIAGKEKLEQLRAGELADLQKKAQETGDATDAQAVRDLSEKCNRFEKRIHDLELTRQVALQTAPQIRMVQASNAVMAEKIQTTVVNTIPLWKNQMVIALGIEHATQAAAAQRQVTDMTNSLLKKNADALKTATVESAKESERGIVDMETLRHTNEQLIATIDEVMQVQREGSEKRRAAEAELAQIESQLKQKLLESAQA